MAMIVQIRDEEKRGVGGVGAWGGAWGARDAGRWRGGSLGRGSDVTRKR